jgi:NAD(P)-dependent dehydrogenase (short-subunit alcohol dehydrogenase family)
LEKFQKNASRNTVDQQIQSFTCLLLFVRAESLWAVVNNAGIATFTEIEWCSLSTFRKQLEVNALGPVLVTKTFLPLLRQSGGGRVVIVASLAGQ